LQDIEFLFSLGKILEENGIRKVRPGEKADICVVNTCSVTELADKKCRQTIRKIARQHPGAFIIVTRCYAQLKPEEISHIPDVDLILGAEQKLDILQYLGDLQNAFSPGRTLRMPFSSRIFPSVEVSAKLSLQPNV